MTVSARDPDSSTWINRDVTALEEIVCPGLEVRAVCFVIGQVDPLDEDVRNKFPDLVEEDLWL